jgi:acyl-CoA hydrolase
MGGDAVVNANEFDLLLQNPALDFPLFAPPREPIALADYAAGLYAATLVPDGGTLQIGIGSLGDAVAQALVLRHRQNADFRHILQQLSPAIPRELGPFATGLYACTEMLVEGLLDLHRAGILKREVQSTDGVAVLHAGFFVGSRAFYKALRDMPPDVVAKFRMTSISYVNELYGGEEQKRKARLKARFLNDAMMATLLGDIVSDGLEDGRVISGVGGQYNFVAQAFALEGARSVMILRASRVSGGKAQSNIRWSYGHTTIPRHLRDIVVTEYGVADLRGKSDRDVIAAMLNITDSRWQHELLQRAKEAGKIDRAYEIPKEARDNTPEAIGRKLKAARDSGLLPDFPFGSDFTEVERKLLPALQTLKLASKRELLAFALHGMWSSPAEADCLERMDLAKPRGLQDRLYAMLVRGALRQPQT